MFARSCMSSRTAYKGLRIDWYPDECEEPLPSIVSLPSASVAPSPKPAGNRATKMMNRFDLLDIDTTETSSEEHSDDETSNNEGVNLAA